MPAATRRMSRTIGFATNQVITLEPLRSTGLPVLNTLDVLVGKLFKLNDREFEATVHFDIVANAARCGRCRTAPSRRASPTRRRASRRS